MRAQRRAVTPRDRALAARSFARHVNRSLLLKPGMHVAIYHAYGHEADASQVIALARRRRCAVYLPVITHFRQARMEFFRFDPRAKLRINAFGIPEPQRSTRRLVSARELDLVFVPLVAFDDSGWRLGSGAGFYDRRLSHLRPGRAWRRPRLIGIAYEFQRVPQLTPHRWDIPLDAVVTERLLRKISLTQP
jgi:5-formyltetrahydrofolate cyclo-ligase